MIKNIYKIKSCKLLTFIKTFTKTVNIIRLSVCYSIIVFLFFTIRVTRENRE